MREGKKLSAAEVNYKTEPGLYGDGHGLYLQVSAFGTKAWVFRYMIDGVARKMGLGPVHTVSLAEARKRAADARLKALDGIDPIQEREAARLARRLQAAKAMTFKQAADAYIEANRGELEKRRPCESVVRDLQRDDARQVGVSRRDASDQRSAGLRDRHSADAQGSGADLDQDTGVGEPYPRTYREGARLGDGARASKRGKSGALEWPPQGGAWFTVGRRRCQASRRSSLRGNAAFHG